MKKTKTEYVVVWFSPRGFANEGAYYYGALAEADELHQEYNPLSSVYSYRSSHRSLAAAKAAAERLARRDHRETPSCELCLISANPFSDRR